jgi:hypothetical protein
MIIVVASRPEAKPVIPNSMFKFKRIKDNQVNKGNLDHKALLARRVQLR